MSSEPAVVLHMLYMRGVYSEKSDLPAGAPAASPGCRADRVPCGAPSGTVPGRFLGKGAVPRVAGGSGRSPRKAAGEIPGRRALCEEPRGTSAEKMTKSAPRCSGGSPRQLAGEIPAREVLCEEPRRISAEKTTKSAPRGSGRSARQLAGEIPGRSALSEEPPSRGPGNCFILSYTIKNQS